jgi:hypothetical protein
MPQQESPHCQEKKKKKKKDSILPARIVKGGPLPWEKFVFGATVAGQGQIYP